ncbi:bifunctional serine/threonine-protein kinase/formylglycine-generating enzyme family protein [Paludisphaera rhizosphaerae]|uniref:bifunctional serine/threonine-protein kinase/formylglycine-generating enzyme family protein n=1 Tax=Paludisphaera rhizosphaerae TaxID=2711216 RepID=UPI0013EDC17B|nr:bifunctional serine/threonine-protein kinase/formylglycine-generating enzyme family protein [Paludisphaera rhizosphaerae]
MSRRPEDASTAFTPEPQRLIVSACESFQMAWRHAPRPTIEAYLQGLKTTQRSAVLQELVSLEVELRSADGDLPTCEEYRERFPDDVLAIEAAFDSMLGAPGPDAAPSVWVEAVDTLGDVPPVDVQIYEDEEPLPIRLGRYRVLRWLGRGGFGNVYLAYDDDLDRPVAIKVPTSRAMSFPGHLETLLSEARLAAGLQHPGIVCVYDVVRSDGDGPAFIVMEYVEGPTLSEILRQGGVELVRAASLIAEAAEAMHHAHQAGLVHRDLKPSNLMIDVRGRVRVADFGLAITEAGREDVPWQVAGTPMYMAPEQVRGESHRLKGGTDIWALGVIFYQLLTGRPPFGDRGHSTLFDEILRRQPKPPRQINEEIPRELERICLKCLVKRMSDRYGSALDLAEDLRAWLSSNALEIASGTFQPETRRLEPKGLRAFEKEDAGCFLDLLPGSRDRDGLPESIRFWKTRIEERDGDETFSVGLLYGPSGCGKSSLLRAGLLPRLDDEIVVANVNAVPDDTETRIQHELRKRLPNLPKNLGLAESFAAIRVGDYPKVLVVLDQFEQWLAFHAGDPSSQMVDALRQCDGGRVQAILAIRDDFAMATARFMAALDAPIVQGKNFVAVDTFDVDHARMVLERFGQAFGRLPEGSPGPSDEQRRFLDAVASGLARDGKVVPVRLALFAEMVKNRPWTPATLDEAGGTEGIGVNFLEETFESRWANPAHRLTADAAREILKALLPRIGSDIKGNMRSSIELREACGLTSRPLEFAALMRVLDGELRLITPTDPPGQPASPEGDTAPEYWQLTHDYLVPSLRTWLTRRQRETRRGRAELRLEECEAIWSSRRERRMLPTLREWTEVRTRTDRSQWTQPQREMMSRAGRTHGLRLAFSGAATAGALALILAGFWREEQIRSEHRAETLVERVRVAGVVELPGLAEDVRREPESIIDRLRAVAEDPRNSQSERLRATYTIVDRAGPDADRLVEFATTASPEELAAIRERLAPFASTLIGSLWRQAEQKPAEPLAQLRIAALLAAFDSEGDRWQGLAPPIVETLLTAQTLNLDAWANLLRPATDRLTPLLQSLYLDPSATSAARVNAARVLSRLADAKLFSELLLRADAPEFVILFSAAGNHRDDVVAAARKALVDWQTAHEGNRRELAVRGRNAVAALIQLGRSDDLQAFLADSVDPTVRTKVILEIRDLGVPPEPLFDLLGRWSEPTARQALLLALEPYQAREWPAGVRASFVEHLRSSALDALNQSERSAARWLLDRWGVDLPTPPEPPGRPTPPTTKELAGRDWWTTPHGHTMVILNGPGGGRFAISAHEVSLGQFRSFREPAPTNDGLPRADTDNSLPAFSITFIDAMQYCRWLSEKEEIPKDQMCYPDIDEIKEEHAILTPDRLRRHGYRLAIEAEWEQGLGKAGTPWFTGWDEQQLPEFAWYLANSGGIIHPIGKLRPNTLGLFDLLGNTTEWCHEDPRGITGAIREHEQRVDGSPLVSRGGCYNWPAKTVGSFRSYHSDGFHYSFTGFRIVRTIPAGQ